MDEMTPAEVAATLRQFNGWRRDFDDKFEQPDPQEVSEAIDAAVKMIDRLEAAEKSDAESLAMYRKARDERDALRAAVRHEADCVEEAKAKIEAMERQEPVAWHSKQYGFVYMSRQAHQFEHGTTLYLRNGTPAWRIDGGSKVALLDMALLPHGTVFYALLGVQGEEK